MGDLYVGTSGLRNSQHGLNVVGHNLANVETEGYVRQQAIHRSAIYQTLGWNHISYMQTGLGVATEQVRQIRDQFLDRTYRTELGREYFYSVQAEACTEIENLFGELQGVAFQDSLEDFWVSLQEIAKEPDSIVTQATLIQQAVSFIERAENIYKGLRDYQINLNSSIQEKADRINELAEGIFELNDKIVKAESNGTEHANDYRDMRNHMLDELSGIISITYKEVEDGRVNVMAEDVPLVSDTKCFRMEVLPKSVLMEMRGEEVILDEMSEVLIPVWPVMGYQEVFNFDKLPEAATNTDIGSLKGVLLARGDFVGKFTDIPTEPVEADFTDTNGNVDDEALHNARVQYGKDVMEYNKKVEPSALVMVQAQFDQLVHGIVTTINDMLCPNKRVKIAGGETITFNDGNEYTFDEDTWIEILDEEIAPVGLYDGEMGVELFSRKSWERYLDRQDILLADGTSLEGVRIYHFEDPDDNYSLYTLGEVEVNPVVLDNKSKLPLQTNDGTGDFDIATAERLIAAWQEPFATLSPNTLTYNNINDYYTQFIGNIGNRGSAYGTLAENQESMVNGVQDKRQAISGVSGDEELVQMIKFQHAYNASARYINVVSEMLEHIIMNLQR